MIVSNELLRGARAALGIGQSELAEMARVSERTLRNVEDGARTRLSTLEALASALAGRGITFLPGGTAIGPGLRMAAGTPWFLLLRGARSARGLKLTDLSRASETNPGTVMRMEAGRPVFPNTMRRIREALENDGISFLPDDEGNGPGFRVALGLLSRVDLRF